MATSLCDSTTGLFQMTSLNALWTSKPMIINNTTKAVPQDPWVEIVEQPKSKGQRFRYKCEGKSAGSLIGENTINDKKTYPSIAIRNYVGPSVIVVSCITKDRPYYPHPHNLVGQNCKDGVCTFRVKINNEPIVFSNVGIQCCKRQDVKESLKVRERIRVDPFGSGYITNIDQIDLGAVRLCFQVFLPDSNKKFTRILKPVISEQITDKKTTQDLIICRVSCQSGKAQGGEEIFMLCDKINKDDIQVRFYQDTEDGVSWEAYGSFTTSDVHRQCAVVFTTPPYKIQEIEKPVKVCMQLCRPSDGESGTPITFQYIPNDSEPNGLTSKQKSSLFNSTSDLFNKLPTSILQDLKDENNLLVNTETFSQDVRMKLKRKAENGMQLKENPLFRYTISESSSNTTLPEYSFLSTGGESAVESSTSDSSNNTIQVMTMSDGVQYTVVDDAFLAEFLMSNGILPSLPGSGGVQEIANVNSSAQIVQFDPSTSNNSYYICTGESSETVDTQ